MQTNQYLSYTLCNCSNNFTEQDSFATEGKYRESLLFGMLAKSFSSKEEVEVLYQKAG